ncbi:hypothetical protein DL98DRAFT_524900 [Cadophora sp. DSE1049]|nr:hypothetical protein DL98DRAFT_524900 [Cadophora sp. DSE1049]
MDKLEPADCDTANDCPTQSSLKQTIKMSDDDNSGKRANQQSYNTTMHALMQENDAESMQSSDTEMTLESAPISETRPNASDFNVTTNSPTIKLEAYTAGRPFDTADKGIEDIEMMSEPHSITEDLIKSLKSRDATHLPIQSTKPDPMTESSQSGVGGTRLSRHSQKRRSDEFTPAPDNSSDLPILKKPRQEEEPEEEPAVEPARKVYRGIGSGNVALSVNDRFSYALPNVSIEQQARREPDFVGEAYYHDLRYDHVQEMMEGNYVIVYSRSLSSNGFDGSFETYTPSITKKRIAMFSLGPATPPGNGKGQSFKYNGDWAEGEFYFNGCFCLFRAQQRFSQDGTTATCTAQLQKPVDENSSGMLGKVLEFGTRKTGSSVRFGMKFMRSIEEQGKWPIHLGFEFIALNLATWDLATGEQTLQRVVGIKIPAKKEVASGFLLNQGE